MNRIWLSFPLEESADATSFYNRAQAFGFDAPPPQNPDLLPDGHPNRDRYFVPLLIQEFWEEAFEQQAKLVSGHANTMPAPEFILRPPPFGPKDDREWASLEAWLLNRDDLSPSMQTLLSNFLESVRVMASVSGRVERMTASQRAQLIYDSWALGDQGLRRANFIVNKNPKPTYWQEVGDSEKTRQNLRESGHEWVVFGPGLLVRFSGIPTEEKRSAILKLTPTQPPATTATVKRPTRAELRELSVPELRRAYLDVVGRPTKSTNRDYLIWKIGQVVKGHIVPGTTKKSPSPKHRAAPKTMPSRRPAAPKATPTASRKTPPTLANSFKTVWATIRLTYLDKGERKAINVRLRMSGLEVHDSESDILYVNSGIPVIDPATPSAPSVEERIKRGTEYATNVALGKAQPMLIPSFLKEHKFRHVEVPDGFAPVSEYASAAWFLEASLHEELKKADPGEREIVLLYLKQLSKAEEASIDEKEDALFILRNFWDRGDVGCAEVMRQLSRQSTGISLRVTDVDATRIRLPGQRIDKDTFLYWPRVDTIRDAIDEKRLAEDHKKAEGLVAVTSLPWTLRELDLSDTAKADESLQTHVNTDARAVELAVSKQAGGGSSLKLMRLYLRGISEVQKRYGIDGTGESTLAFVRENWKLGDVGAAQKYEAELARQDKGTTRHGSVSPKRGVSHHDARLIALSRPSRDLDARLRALETRLKRRIS